MAGTVGVGWLAISRGWRAPADVDSDKLGGELYSVVSLFPWSLLYILSFSLRTLTHFLNPFSRFGLSQLAPHTYPTSSRFPS